MLSTSLSIEDFRGDYDRLASLMQLSWADNVKQPLLYSAEFLASVFEYPGAGFSLAPTLYDGSEPIAFVAGFPRHVRIKDRQLSLAIGSFLSVSREYKKRGYGIVVWSELVKRVRARGFDGMMNYCVEGEPMNGMILGCCRRLNVPVAPAYTVHYLSCYLWPKDAGAGGGPSSPGIIERFMELAAPVTEHAALARIWSRPEAEWQCVRRLGAVVAEHSVEQRRGILAGTIMPIADPKRTKCLIIDDILWGDLEREERFLLVRQLKSKAATAGARMVIVPVLGYADMEPFISAGLRPSQRTVQAYLSAWKDPSEREGLDSMYLDVF